VGMSRSGWTYSNQARVRAESRATRFGQSRSRAVMIRVRP
jgi:hypothetical protein